MIVEVAGVKALHFTKIIDSYEEPEEGDPPPSQVYDEKYWADNAPATLDCFKAYKDLLEQSYGDVPAKYFETYASMIVGGIARVWVQVRKNGRALIQVKYAESGIPEAVEFLTKEGVAFRNPSKIYLTFNVNLQQLKDKMFAHEWIVQRLSPQHLLHVGQG